VLLDAACSPLTSWGFEAVLVLFGGQWPARGLLSGHWPPLSDEHSGRGSSTGASAPIPRIAAPQNGAAHTGGGRAKLPKQAGSQFCVMVHCASIRQLAYLESLQVWLKCVPEHSDCTVH